MINPLKRREFIKAISLAGASISISEPVSAKRFFSDQDVEDLKNEYFTVSFDKKKGAINIHRAGGVPLLIRGVTCINLFKNGAKSGTNKYIIAPSHYQYSIRFIDFDDEIGPGRKMVVSCMDSRKTFDFEIQLSLYNHTKVVFIEAICKNVSRQDILISSIEPLRVIKDEGATMKIDGVSKCITNGEMYFDTGAIHQFGSTDNAISSGNLKGVQLANGSISSQNETIHSWWNAAFFCGDNKEGVVVGYVENNRALGNLLISKTGDDEVSFVAESAYTPYVMLKTGQTLSSDRFMICLGDNIYTALENYAASTGKVNRARVRSIVNGWCSWFYTLAQVSEDEVLANAAFASKNLKKFGLEYVQIDEGYQRWHGDWEGNERFPHGMKWLAGKIKEYGFKPGIWISPYVISEPTEVFQKHPEWLLKNADGSLKRIGNWPQDSEPPADENPKRYCLDITHPQAARWLHQLVGTISNDWGYQMIKIDFVAWSILAADHYYDPSLSSAQVYRKGLETIRDAAGESCHILDCGPGAVTVGLIDSMRIEADVNYGFSKAAWDTYFLHEASSASAAAKRYYFHKRTWINDADHICMDLLNSQQAEAAATLIALSGGNMISGDRLIQMDAYKLDILKKITPSFGEAAIPVELFGPGEQSVFVLKIKRNFGEWIVAAFFNASLEKTREEKFSLNRLGLDQNKTYVAFDFWKQTLVGEITNELNIIVQPGSVTLLAFHEKTGNAQFISTDRHVTQGALEIETVNWDQTAKTFSGTSTGPLNTSHNVFVYVPKPIPWTWGGSGLFRDYDSYSLKLIDQNIIRVHVNFEKGDKVSWKINMNEFAG